VDDALSVACPHAQSAVAQYREHRRVLGEHVGLEARDAVGAGDVGELLQEPACDAAALYTKVLGD